MYTISAADFDALHDAIYFISRAAATIFRQHQEEAFREMCKAQAMIDRVTRHATREK